MAARRNNNQTRVLHALTGSTKTLGVLSSELKLTRRQVTDAAFVLARKGFVKRVRTGCFRLTLAGELAVASGVVITSGPNAPFEAARRPMADTLRQRAWTAMRIQRGFTINDLLVASADGAERNAVRNLQRYLAALSTAGVVRRMKRRVAGTRLGSGGFLKYQLLMDLGEIAPVVRSARGVLHDHNSGLELTLGVTDR